MWPHPSLTPERCCSSTSPNAECRNVISVPPSTSLSRYCTFETTAYDINSGPENSSSVGRLIACTFAQKCPLPSPKSRYHRPPGHASIFIGIGLSSAPPIIGPSCSSSASNVFSSDARTCISCTTFSVKSSIFIAVAIMLSPLAVAGPCLNHCLNDLLQDLLKDLPYRSSVPPVLSRAATVDSRISQTCSSTRGGAVSRPHSC